MRAHRILPAVLATASLLLGTVQAAPGDIDSSFGTGGIVVAGVGPGTGNFQASVMQPDGKLVTAGTCSNGANFDFCVARFNTDGTRDLFFANGGNLVLPIGSGDDVARAVKLQADGKIVIGGACFNDALSITSFCVARLNPDGSTDGTFGPATAKVVTAIGADGVATVAALEILADGRILAGGMCRSGGSAEMCMARYTPAGDLDLTFGTGGLVVQSIGVATEEELNTLALQPDGKILAGGSCVDVTFFRMCVARFLDTGALDTSFGTGGSTLITAGAQSSFTYNVLLQADGKIVSAGGCANPVNTFCVARLNADGSLDTVGFGSGTGIVETSVLAQQDMARAAVLQSDGKILQVGSCANGAQVDFCAARYNTDGTLDTAGFAAPNGKFFTPATGNENPMTVALQSNDHSISAGSCLNGLLETPCLVRFNDAGVLDTGYGSGGGLVLDRVGYARGTPAAMQALPDGRTVVAGTCPGNLDDEFCAARFDTNGGFDASFGAGQGRVNLSVGPGHDEATATILQPDGKLVIGGACDVGAGVFNFCLVRLLPDGTFNTAFGNLGTVVVPILGESDRLTALALQPDGKIVAVGTCLLAGVARFCVARFNADGSLDTGFGTNGTMHFPVASENDQALAVALQADGRIVIAGTCLNAGTPRYCIARLDTDGSFDAGFGPGTPFANLTFAHDLTASVNIVSSQRILIGATCPGATNLDFCLLRLNPDGSIDATFNGSGQAIATIGPGDNKLTAVAIQGDGRIVAAGQCLPSDNWVFCVARFEADGAVDTGFGTGGFVNSPLSSSNAYARALLIAADGRMVVAGEGMTAFARGFMLARFLPSALSTTTMATSPNPSVFGGQLTLQVTVAGSSPTGSVEFFNGATSICSTGIDGDGLGACSGAVLPAGTYDFRAAYSGDGGNLASMSDVHTHTIDRAPATVRLTSSRARLPPGGRPVDFAVAVKDLGIAPTGSIIYRDGLAAIGSQVLTGGGSALSANGIATLGLHLIAADYTGDANYLAATSNAFPLHVGVAADANGDGFSDLTWRDGDGQAAAWLMNGATATSTGIIFGGGTGWSIKTADADFDGDGKADLLWLHTSGAVALWLMDGMTPVGQALLFGGGGGWELAHIVDLDGNGRADLIWRNPDRTVAAWLMDGLTVSASTVFMGPGSVWTLTHMADLNGDGRADFIWQGDDTSVAAWLMDGFTYVDARLLFTDGGWSITHAGDLNGDGKADLLWQATDGRIAAWLMDGLGMIDALVLLDGGSGWTITFLADLNGDDRQDLIWVNAGRYAAWLMNGLSPTLVGLLVDPANGSTLARPRDLNGDASADLLWQFPDGHVEAWLMAGLTPMSMTTIFTGGGGWVVAP